ncbi:hypothetical protein NM688_g1769 [Phlebia brevispora]|uniref:Uncharacterized protein n=1 Tax=Phlebia brevispora TaxID=194682 RepID=A0ACC1TAV9_9APHY|nr:hypothetical protein NM688_g1769 [Phlebia brevispora]
MNPEHTSERLHLYATIGGFKGDLSVTAHSQVRVFTISKFKGSQNGTGQRRAEAAKASIFRPGEGRRKTVYQDIAQERQTSKTSPPRATKRQHSVSEEHSNVGPLEQEKERRGSNKRMMRWSGTMCWHRSPDPGRNTSLPPVPIVCFHRELYAAEALSLLFAHICPPI